MFSQFAEVRSDATFLAEFMSTARDLLLVFARQTSFLQRKREISVLLMDIPLSRRDALLEPLMTEVEVGSQIVPRHSV